MTARSCRISGRVQGVGFRAWVESEALSRGLSGWVRNRRSGEVEAVFSGGEAIVEEMIGALWTGPAGASVTAVESGGFDGEVVDGFELRSTV